MEGPSGVAKELAASRPKQGLLIPEGWGVAAMKISNLIPQIKADTKIGKNRSAEAAEATGSSAGTDRVQLSASSLDVQKMKSIIQETPPVRMDRVQALKEQIERGDYQVDPYRVADKMLMNLLSESGMLKE